MDDKRISAHQVAEAECARLCVDFANHLDARRYEEVLNLFADDGVLDRMGTVFSGRGELQRFLASRPVDLTTRHLCTNIRVSVDGTDDATGMCYVLFFQGSSDVPSKSAAPPSVVEYHDRYSRTPTGRRIQERLIRMAIRG